MSDPRPALDALLDELTRNGSPLKKFMRPGLPRDHVARLMSEVGARPHEDAISVYAWHDGFDRFAVPMTDEGMVSLFPSHREFNPLEETLALFSQWRETSVAEAGIPQRNSGSDWGNPDPDEIWSRSWFPLFQGGGSEVVFISSDQADPGSVWRHPIQDEPRRLFDSLADAADAIRVAVVDGRIRLNALGAYIGPSVRTAGIEF